MTTERIITCATVCFRLIGSSLSCCIVDDHASDPKLIVWSNFEIADMVFWRSDVYMSFFEFLDEKGGFYYEVCHLLGSGIGVILWALMPVPMTTLLTALAK